MNGHIRSVADQYAADGYIALAPDVFWRTQPRVELGYEGADREKAMELLQKTKLDAAVADMSAAGSRISRLRRGRWICRWLTMAAASRTRSTRRIRSRLPMQFHYGGLDAHIPQDAVDAVRQKFAGRKDSELYVYPQADHGFNCGDRASYNAKASGLAHGRTLKFLGEHL